MSGDNFDFDRKITDVKHKFFMAREDFLTTEDESMHEQNISDIKQLVEEIFLENYGEKTDLGKDDLSFLEVLKKEAHYDLELRRGVLSQEEIKSQSYPQLSSQANKGGSETSFNTDLANQIRSSEEKFREVSLIVNQVVGSENKFITNLNSLKEGIQEKFQQIKDALGVGNSNEREV